MTSTPDSTWYSIANATELDTPALVIYPERVLANIRTAKQMVTDISHLRPHAKTHKSMEATRLLLAEGVTKFKCATIAEAEMLALAGAKDILLAYQPVGPKVIRFRTLVTRYRGVAFSCLIDDADAACNIARGFSAESIPLSVFIDLNVGMNRTGVAPGEPAVALFKACASIPGLTITGLHAYDGHIQDNDMQIRSERCAAAFKPVVQLRDDLARMGAGSLAVVAGGSPTFPIHARKPELECSPGTFIYWDKSYQDGLSEQAFQPAALLLTRVVSRPTADIFCLDLGHKSVAAEKDIHHRVSLLNAPDVEVLGQSEEHLLVRARVGGSYQVGDLFYGVPYHICPTCALYERAATVTDGKAAGEWTMLARNRSINI